MEDLYILQAFSLDSEEISKVSSAQTIHCRMKLLLLKHEDFEVQYKKLAIKILPFTILSSKSFYINHF